MKFDNDDVSALIGTIIIHLIVIFILYFGILRTFVPIDDGGIPVVFGDIYASVGASQPPPSRTVTTPSVSTTPATVRPTPQPENRVITQNRTETVSVPEKPKDEGTKVDDERARREREEAARKQREEDERRRQEQEQKRQQARIDNLASVFGEGNSSDNQQSEATGRATNEGSPFGNSTTGAPTGSGGVGTFNLGGRSIGAGGLPRPQFLGQQDGRIVINITVNPNGDVISTEIGRGTNIDDLSLRNDALAAAKRAKFNRIAGSNNQSGTITYNYRYAN